MRYMNLALDCLDRPDRITDEPLTPLQQLMRNTCLIKKPEDELLTESIGLLVEELNLRQFNIAVIVRHSGEVRRVGKELAKRAPADELISFKEFKDFSPSELLLDFNPNMIITDGLTHAQIDFVQNKMIEEARPNPSLHMVSFLK